MFVRRPPIAASLILAVASVPVLADEMTFTPSKDNTLYQSSMGTLSNGSGERLFAGRTGPTGGGGIRRALIAFDVGTIPAGSRVNRVTLTLNLSRTLFGPPRSVSVQRVLNDWGEGISDALDEEGQGTAAAAGDATWLHTFSPASLWQNPGGDFAQQASASLEIGSVVGSYTWESTAELVSDVQSWVDDPSGNFGWLLRRDETEGSTAKRFDSRESSASTRPILTVDFTPPAPDLPHKLFFAQFGNGAGLIFSQILLINRDGDNEAFARLIQKGDEGELLSVPLDGMIPEQGELDILIPPNGIRILQSDGQGEVVTGSLTVCSDRVLAGVILFGGPTGLAGVGSSEELVDGFTAPMQSNTTSKINTGIAVQNLQETPVTLDVELLDLDGNLIATDQIEIAGMGHKAQFVTEFNWSVPPPIFPTSGARWR